MKYIQANGISPNYRLATHLGLFWSHLFMKYHKIVGAFVFLLSQKKKFLKIQLMKHSSWVSCMLKLSLIALHVKKKCLNAMSLHLHFALYKICNFWLSYIWIFLKTWLKMACINAPNVLLYLPFVLDFNDVSNICFFNVLWI